jgi:hypothetical protein
MATARIQPNTVTVIIGVILGLGVLTSTSMTTKVDGQAVDKERFAGSFQGIVDETRLLDQDYQAQVKKWQTGELSNETMASITDTYLPRFQVLINRTNDLQTPTGYENVTNLYAKSIESELESYNHFRNYLLTGNITENKASDQSLSDAFKYEMESFKAFKSASNATNG